MPERHAVSCQRKTVKSVTSAAPANVSQTAALRQRGTSAISLSALSDGMFVVNSGRNASNRLRVRCIPRPREDEVSRAKGAHLRPKRAPSLRHTDRNTEFRVRGNGRRDRFDGRDHGARLARVGPGKRQRDARHGIRRIVPKRDGCVPVLIRDARIACEHFDIPSVRRTSGVRTIVHHAPLLCPFMPRGMRPHVCLTRDHKFMQR